MPAADFPYFTTPPVGLAHRGGWLRGSDTLENTMPAFAAAVELGYSYVETDVHATSDGVLVAFHDVTLDRVTDGHGILAEQPWSVVRRARVGGLEPIPTLAEILSTWPDLRVNLDIKSAGAIGPLWECIREHAAYDRVCVGSFSHRRLAAFRALAQGRVATAATPREVARLRFLPRPLTGRPNRAAAVAQVLQIPETVSLRGRTVRLVTPALLDRAHEAGMQVHVWTVNDEADMRRLLEEGVDGIVTDRTDLLAGVLTERGAWPPGR